MKKLMQVFFVMQIVVGVSVFDLMIQSDYKVNTFVWIMSIASSVLTVINIILKMVSYSLNYKIYFMDHIENKASNKKSLYKNSSSRRVLEQKGLTTKRRDSFWSIGGCICMWRFVVGIRGGFDLKMVILWGNKNLKYIEYFEYFEYLEDLKSWE